MSTKPTDARSVMERIIERNGRHNAAQELADMKRRYCVEALRDILSDVERFGTPTPSAIGSARQILAEADEARELAMQIGREPLEAAA